MSPTRLGSSWLLFGATLVFRSLDKACTCYTFRGVTPSPSLRPPEKVVFIATVESRKLRPSELDCPPDFFLVFFPAPFLSACSIHCSRENTATLLSTLPRSTSNSVESKDLNGATVARAGLTVSLSCLGATGSLIHLTPARTGAASYRASGNGFPSAAAPPRPDHSTPDGSTQGGLPVVHDQWTTEGTQLDGQARGHAPVAKQPGTDHLMCSHTEAGSSRCGDGRKKESGSGAGGTSAGAECWTCEYNPRDGRLVGPMSSAAAVVEPTAAAAAGRDVSNADLGPKCSGTVSPGDPCPAVEEETGAAAAVGGPPGDSAGAEADGNGDAETATKTPPVRLSVAVSASKNDWLGSPGGDSRLEETPLQTEGCCSLDEKEGGGKKPDETAATEEEGVAGAGQGRNKAARNFPGAGARVCCVPCVPLLLLSLSLFVLYSSKEVMFTRSPTRKPLVPAVWAWMWVREGAGPYRGHRIIHLECFVSVYCLLDSSFRRRCSSDK